MFEIIKKKLIKLTTEWAKEGVLRVVGDSMDRSLNAYSDETELGETEHSSISNYHSFLEERLENEIDEYFERMR